MDVADAYVTFVRHSQDMLREKVNEEVYTERLFEVRFRFRRPSAGGGGVAKTALAVPPPPPPFGEIGVGLGRANSLPNLDSEIRRR